MLAREEEMRGQQHPDKQQQQHNIQSSRQMGGSAAGEAPSIILCLEG